MFTHYEEKTMDLEWAHSFPMMLKTFSEKISPMIV